MKGFFSGPITVPFSRCVPLSGFEPELLDYETSVLAIDTIGALLTTFIEPKVSQFVIHFF